MLVLVGIGIVLAAVVGGFLLESGNLLVLLQPAELLIIVGSAVGIMLAANPASAVKNILRGVMSVFKPPPYTPAFYHTVLKMLYELFSIGRRHGLPALETHIEDPETSQILANYPEVTIDRAAMAFLYDSLRMLTTGSARPGELSHLMDLDMEVQRKERHGPVTALGMLADSLPGLGIVAAVLGVVVTMQALGNAPEEIGQRVAAALVGTFLGILLCYGVVGPLASHLEHRNEGRTHLLQCFYSGVHAYSRGSSPLLAAEFARRSIPSELRPSFDEMETTFRREVKIPPFRLRSKNMQQGNEPDFIQPIRRTGDHGQRHRGGSWKVAYADFVTALMALFIVLWLMNSSRQVQQAISAYFRDPKGHARSHDTAPGRGGGGGDSIALDKSNIGQLKEQLEQAIRSLPELGKLRDQVQISITAEGLRVELLETEQGLFFETGRPEPSTEGERMLALLATELGRLRNPVVVEGHTDARPYRYTGLNGYTNWELSVDRANAARRFMQDHGVDPGQIVQVRGFADKRLLNPTLPDDSRNRRISLVVEYNQPPPKPDPFGESAARAPVLR